VKGSKATLWVWSAIASAGLTLAFLYRVLASPVLDASLVGAFAALATLAVVFYQIYLTLRQLELMHRQDDILARRSVLVVSAALKPGGSPEEMAVVFKVTNSGTAAAHGYYWNITVLSDAVDSWSHSIESQKETGLKIGPNGAPIRWFRGWVDKPLFPSRTAPFADVILRRVTQAVVLFAWEAVSEHGVFPDNPEDRLIVVKVLPDE
jgi:hypothetical protein